MPNATPGTRSFTSKALNASPSFRGQGVSGSTGSGSTQWAKTNWKSAIGRVVETQTSTRNPAGVTKKKQSLADIVHKLKVESSAQAARRLLRSARARTKKAVAAKGSRSVIFSSGYLYFLVLERNWWFTVCLACLAYFVAIMMTWCVSLPLTLWNEQDEIDLNESSRPALALRFAAAHVITGSSASILPVDDIGYLVAYLSMLVGVVVNVFVFAAVVAKFQSPQKDLVWSTRGVITKRDDVPTLLIRVGNLRCHTLYNPTIRCTLLSRHVTKEGEGFMKKEVVEVMQPATISGVHTIACAVNRKSPLFPILKTSRFVKCPVLGEGNGTLDLGDHANDVMNKENHTRDTAMDDPGGSSDGDSEDSNAFQWLLHVTFTALDPIYGAELCSHTTYADDSLVGPARFKDVIGVDENGRPVIDWHAFDEHVDGCEHDAEESDDETDGDEDDVGVAPKVTKDFKASTVVSSVAATVVSRDTTTVVAHDTTTVALREKAPEKQPSPVRSEISDDSAKELVLGAGGDEQTVEGTRGDGRGRYRSQAPSATDPVRDLHLDANETSTSTSTATGGEFVFRSTTCGPAERALPGPEGNPIPGNPRIAVLAARASMGLGDDIDGDSKQGPLLTCCVYCVRLCLLFAEAGVKFELVEIDRNCKQSWFRDAFPEFLTPAVQGTPGGVDDSGEWFGDSNRILQRARETDDRVATTAVIRGQMTLTTAAKLGETLKAALVCGRVLGTNFEQGKQFVQECLEKCGVDENVDEQHTRTALVEVGAETVLEIESLLTHAEKPPGPFLGGQTPDAADAYLVPALWVAHNLLESGVARCFAKKFKGNADTPCTFHDLGGSSIVTYLENWSRRDSWSQTLRARDTVKSAASIRHVVDFMVAVAPDTCDVGDMLSCMNRARRVDTYYQRALRLFADIIPPVPPFAERPKRTPGRDSAWRPEAAEEAHTPGALGGIVKTVGGGDERRSLREESVRETSFAEFSSTSVDAPLESAPVAPVDADAPTSFPPETSNPGLTKQESQKKAKKRKPTKSRTNATICI